MKMKIYQNELKKKMLKKIDIIFSTNENIINYNINFITKEREISSYGFTFDKIEILQHIFNYLKNMIDITNDSDLPIICLISLCEKYKISWKDLKRYEDFKNDRKDSR